MKAKILFLSMLLPVFAATGFAQTSGTCGENLTWTLENGTLTISGTEEMEDSPWYSYRSSITTVVIGNGVTTVTIFQFLLIEPEWRSNTLINSIN